MDKYQREMEARVAARCAQIETDAVDLPMDERDILALAKIAYADLNEGICRGDGSRSRAARRRLDALAFNLAGRDHGGSYGAQRHIEMLLAPPAGEVPTWGLDGEFLAIVEGIAVRCSKKGAHLTLEAVDATRPFVSDTGFRSCLSGFSEGGDVMSSTVATIKKILQEEGRQVIKPRYREHIEQSQPSWVKAALERYDTSRMIYEDGPQMAFAF